MAEEHKVERTVVVAMDGSEYSKYAFEWFVKNMHRTGDHVVVVHSVELHDVLHSTQWYYAPGAFDETTLNKLLDAEYQTIRKELEHYADMMKEHHVQGSVKSIHCNKPGEGVIKEAETAGASFIVVGSRGKGKIRRTIIGSTSDYIMNHAHIPVVVCRHKDHHHHHGHHHHGFHLFGHHHHGHHEHGDDKHKHKHDHDQKKHPGDADMADVTQGVKDVSVEDQHM